MAGIVGYISWCSCDGEITMQIRSVVAGSRAKKEIGEKKEREIKREARITQHLDCCIPASLRWRRIVIERMSSDPERGRSRLDS